MERKPRKMRRRGRRKRMKRWDGDGSGRGRGCEVEDVMGGGMVVTVGKWLIFAQKQTQGRSREISRCQPIKRRASVSLFVLLLPSLQVLTH